MDLEQAHGGADRGRNRWFGRWLGRCAWLLVALQTALPAAAQTFVKDSRGRIIQLLDTDGVTVLVQWSYQGFLTTPSTFWVYDWTDPSALVISQPYTATDSAREAAVVAMLPQLTSQAGFDAFSGAMAQDFALSEIATVEAAPVDITADFLVQATSNKAVLYFLSSDQPIYLPVSVIVAGGQTLSFGTPGQALMPGSGIAVTYSQQSSTPIIQVLTQPPLARVPLPYNECVAACKDKLENWEWGCGMAMIAPPPIDMYAAMCAIAAKAGEYQCIHTRCAPPPPGNNVTFWCDETVSLSTVATSVTGPHCGQDPVALVTQFCDQYSYANPGPQHMLPNLPLVYQDDPDDGGLACIQTQGIGAGSLVYPTTGVHRWALCLAGTPWAGSYILLQGIDPQVFCATPPVHQ